MVNYKLGKIYRLCSLINDKIYVGSTCQTLCARYSGHKRKAKIQKNRLVYKHINQIGWNNYKIILIENYPCNNKAELEKRERYYIEKLKAELNYYIPTRTKAEYKIDNKDLIKNIYKKYRKDNKHEIQQKNKTYMEHNKEKIKAYHTVYSKAHAESISQKHKLHYLANKNSISFVHKIYYLNLKYETIYQQIKATDNEYQLVINEWNALHSNF